MVHEDMEVRHGPENCEVKEHDSAKWCYIYRCSIKLFVSDERKCGVPLKFMLANSVESL